MDPTTRSRLLGIFVAEAEEILATLEDEARKLDESAGERELQEFGRMAHGLKGAASAVGLAELAGCLHDLERVALGLPSLEPPERLGGRARVVKAVDLLREGVAAMAGTGSDAFPSELLQRVSAALHGSVPEAPGKASVPPAASRSAEEPTPVAERISVPAEDIDGALRLASAMARGLTQVQEELGQHPLSRSLQGLGAEAARLEAAIATFRLVPAECALSGLSDEVAQVARRLGKEVELEVRGTAVQADRRTLTAARRLIGHLVRNAIDHGIEAPAARFAAGKPVKGRVSVSFVLADSALHVTVEDDGAGFDVPAIRAELTRRGEDPGRVAALADAEVLYRFALAGGSTRSEATLVSGRGLGLSAVAALARGAGGDLSLRSERGKGSAVRFSLPPEVYALEVLVTFARGRPVGLPIAAVERVVHLRAEEAEAAHLRTLAVGESILPFVSLGSLLGATPAGASRFAVVVRAAEGSLALGVEEMGALLWLVPHSIAGLTGKDAHVLGLSRLADGRALAILNPRQLRVESALRYEAEAEAPHAPSQKPIDLVLAEDSLATREVLRVLLQERGYQVRLAADGEEALGRIAERMPDVLVTDLNMPRRDGLSLTRALRALPDTARLPVVLLTSQDDDATRSAGAAAGADAYLLKSSFNADVLEQTLQRLGVRSRP